MTTVAEGALRRYGRATYDVSARLAEVGDELYIRTRASLDEEEVSDVNDRLARGTYSQSLKSFPRRGPSSPRITVVIANTHPPFSDVSPRQMNAITSRLLKPTLVSRLRQTSPVTRSPPTSRPGSRSASSTPRLHPPGYVPPGILRLESSYCSSAYLNASRSEDPNASRADESNTSKDDLDRSNLKVRFAIKSPAKNLQSSPYGMTKWRSSKENTSGSSDDKPKDTPEVPRSKSAPARAQRTLPEVDNPTDILRREHVKNNKKDGNTKNSPQRQKKTDTGNRVLKGGSSTSSKPYGSPQVNRSQSSRGERFNRLNFIATILEAEEYEYA